MATLPPFSIDDFSSVRVPPLPCGLDGQFYDLQSTIDSSVTSVTGQYSPGNIAANIESLQFALRSQFQARLFSLVENSFPETFPKGLQYDILNLLESIATPETFKTKLQAIADKYTDPANADYTINQIIQLLTQNPDFDICSGIPNVNILADGSLVTMGLPTKIASEVPVIGSIQDVVASIPTFDDLVTTPALNALDAVFDQY